MILRMKRLRIRSHFFVTIFFATALLALVAPALASAATIQAQHRPWAQQSGLVGYWSLNGKDISGVTAYDRSGQGLNGTIEGTPALAAGRVGQAMNFDGTNDRVDLGDVAVLGGVSQFTLMGWMKRSAPNAIVNISQYRETPQECNTIEMWSGGALSFYVGSNCPGGTMNLNDTEWHHVALVFDGTQTGNSNRLKGFVDGVEQVLSYSGTVPATSPNIPSSLYIGHDGSATYSSGTIDEVRVYNRALSANEVKALANAGQAKLSRTDTAVRSGLVGWWTFDGKDVIPISPIYPANSDEGNMQDLLTARKVTLTATQTFSGITMYTTTSGGNVRYGLYDATGPSGQPGNKLAETPEIFNDFGYSPAYFPNRLALGPGDYWVAFLVADNGANTRKDSASGSYCRYSYTYGSLPATFSTSPTCGTTDYSIFLLPVGAKDKSGNGNDGILYNEPSQVPGKSGQALRFDGVDDFIEYSSNIQFNSNDFTVSGWAKLAGPGGGIDSENFIFVQRVDGIGAGNPVVDLYFDSSLRPTFGFRDDVGSGAGTQDVSAASTGIWYHLVGVKTATEARLYVNGVLVDTDVHTMTGDFDSGSVHRFIGKNSYESVDKSFMNGSIDDVRVYNRALSAAEVKTIYNEGVGAVIGKNQANKVPSGLVGYWSFNGPDFTDRVYDRSGQGNHGYVYGVATSSIKASGRVGQGIALDGTNDHVLIGDINTMEGIPALTASAWVKLPGSVTNERHIIDKGDCTGSLGSWELMVGGSGAPQFYIYGATYAEGPQEIDDGQWHHVTGVTDGTNIVVYVDGVPGNTAASGNLASNSIPVEIGGYCNGGGSCGGSCFWPGSIDEVRVYNRALSAQEVKQLYNLGR
jgi:hypothetical protein